MAGKLSSDDAVIEILGKIQAGIPCEEVLADLLVMLRFEDSKKIAQAWREFSHDECGVPDYENVAAQIMGEKEPLHSCAQQ